MLSMYHAVGQHVSRILNPFGSTKTARFRRSNGSTVGLLGSKAVQSIIRFEASTGPETWSVDGSTGRSGPIFKTLDCQVQPYGEAFCQVQSYGEVVKGVGVGG